MAYYLSKPIIIADYDPQWPALYRDEQQALLEVLGPIVVQIEHIGSTSVPGLAAKPIIDISVAVRDRAEITPHLEELGDLGYVEQPIMAHFERRILTKGAYNEGTHHLHVTEYGSQVWADPILLRDYLREHQEVARTYGEVKRAAANQHGNDLNGYHDDKSPYLAQVLDQARVWQERRTDLAHE